MMVGEFVVPVVDSWGVCGTGWLIVGELMVESSSWSPLNTLNTLNNANRGKQL